MESYTITKTLSDEELIKLAKQRIDKRNKTEDEWIDGHASGTLRKAKKMHAAYKSAYISQRIHYEFGSEFEILPRSQVTWGDAFHEEDSMPITEGLWYSERYIESNVFGDYLEYKYIQATYRDVFKGETERKGNGLILRETSAKWVPQGNVVFAIIVEWDSKMKEWKNAANPF